MFNTVSNQFQKFYDFAQAHVNDQDTKAKINTAVGSMPLGERSITAKSGDHFGVFRLQSTKDVNNNVRTLFKKAVVDMFGGESNIPQAVKEAMRLSDYNKGKPLTARRILAVANAIIAADMKNAFQAEGTLPGEMALQAEEAGFLRKDFGLLNTAANLYAKAFGGSLKDALTLAMDRTSDVYAVMSAGSLYMKDVASFKRGILAHQQTAAIPLANKAIVKAAVASGNISGLAKVAENRAAELRKLLDDPAQLLDFFDPNATQDPLAGLRQVITTAAADLEAVAQRIKNGEITDEREAVNKVIYNANDLKLTTKFEDVLRNLYKASADKPGLGEVRKVLDNVKSRLVREQDELGKTFVAALADREFPRIQEKISAASNEVAKNTGKPLDISNEVVSNLKRYIVQFRFNGLDAIDKFIEVLKKNGDSSLHFNDDQKARLKNQLVTVLGEQKAEKAFPQLVSQLEGAFFTELLRDQEMDEVRPLRHRPETVVAHFEKYPDMLKAMNVGFDLGKLDQLKAALKNEIRKDITKGLDPKTSGDTSLASGILPQGVREYNKGIVTFNGENIRNGRDDRTICEHATEPARRGYAEFLEEKFPEDHRKMRQTVSVICGMASGLGGAIDTLLGSNGMDDKEDKLLLGVPRFAGLLSNTVLMPRNRPAGENYDITMDDNGDVTIKLTHFAITTLSNITNEKGETATFAMMDTQQPIIGMTKMVATVRVPNVPDSALGDGMPDFEITDFVQEEMM